MSAPVSIAYTHVHSLRIASGTEALVARVLATGGSAGFGFTLNLDAGVARDMAAWDAHAQAKRVPLYALLGGTYRKKVSLIEDRHPAIAPDWTALRKDILEDRYELLRIDPFAWGSVEMVQTIGAVATAFDLGIALLAPNAHPWELAYCGALAATLKGEDTRIIVRQTPAAAEMNVSDLPGLGIDWSLEPAFSTIRWQS